MPRINLSEITSEEFLLYTKYRKFFARIVELSQRDCHYIQKRYGPRNPSQMYKEKKEGKKVKPEKSRKYRRDQPCKRKTICRYPKFKKKPS